MWSGTHSEQESKTYDSCPQGLDHLVPKINYHGEELGYENPRLFRELL